MTPYHIITQVFGDQPSQFALIRIDSAVRKTVNSARSIAVRFAKKHGGSPSVRHISYGYSITFLSSIPESFHAAIHPDDIYTECFRAIHHLDEAAFLKSAEEANLICPTECTGLLIWPDTVRILGYEKHSSDLLDTEDILSLILNRRAA